MTDKPTTDQLFDDITRESRTIFEAKLEKYGPSLMVFRVPSLLDKLWIKAHRIREIEELGDRRQIPEGRREEYLAIVNYSTVVLMKLWYPDQSPDELPDAIAMDSTEVLSAYDDVLAEVKSLLMKKNHDYGGAWQGMDIRSLTDIILDKILRVKSQLDQEGDVPADDVASEILDILNYSVFSVAKLDEE